MPSRTAIGPTVEHLASEASCQGRKPMKGHIAERPITRIMLVVESGVDHRAVSGALRDVSREISVRSPREAVSGRIATERFDLVILHTESSGPRATELLARMTEGNPSLPVIVVTVPPGDKCPAGEGVDPALLVLTVDETLRGPRIKRLIRVCNT
jgi:hypothetical protein